MFWKIPLFWDYLLILFACELDNKAHWWKKGRRSSVLTRWQWNQTWPPYYWQIYNGTWKQTDELHCHICWQKDLIECSVLCFTKTWLSAVIPDRAIQPSGFTVHRVYCNTASTGKTKGGGVCLFVNNNMHKHKIVSQSCSSVLNFFLCILRTAVYIIPEVPTAAELDAWVAICV